MNFLRRFRFFSKKTPRSVYSTIHALLSICSENVQKHWSWLIQPFADKPRQELLSGSIRLGPMWCRTILSTFRTKRSKIVIPLWNNQVNTLYVLVIVHSVHCQLYCILQCTTLHYSVCAVSSVSDDTTSTSGIWRRKVKAPSAAGVRRHWDLERFSW